MTELIFSNQSMPTSQLAKQCGLAAENISGLSCGNPELISPHTPYLMCEDPTSQDRDIMRLFHQPKVSKNVTGLALSLGEENTLAIADIYDKLRNYNIGLMGASTAVYGKRLSGFGEAVKNYQGALMEYRQVMKEQIGTPAKTLAKQRVNRTFQSLQQGYRHELNAITSANRAGRKGVPLTNVTRATRIARSSRNIAALNLTNRVQASKLAQLGQHAKLLGNGLAVIDFSSRIGNIHNSYQAGENWERDLFIESSSFALSASAGIAAVNVGSAALGFLLVATPIGWVGLVIGGVAVAGIAAGASIGMNTFVNENSGQWYDSIMKSISEK